MKRGQKMQENVLIVAVQKQTDDENRLHYSIEELQSLIETADGSVVDIVMQKRDHPHPALYLGSGKLEEITTLIDELEVDIIIANDELSATQMRNLQKHLDVPVIDRSQLILDIFANRAQTKEGKLQVELAQYKYMLPRLHGQGQALSRLGGGIGTRGPGETKLETDRRHINRRIDEIKAKLETVVNQRAQYRKRRKTNKAFQIAIVGYTNAGKSTLFNRLTKSDAFEQDQLFATLDPMSRQMQFPSGLRAIVTDTVGFMQDLPTALIAAFRSTLEEVTEADFIYHVVDAAHPDHRQHQATVVKLLQDLKADQIPMLTVFNKKDLLTEAFIPSTHPSIIASAYDQIDRKRMLEKTEELLKEHWEFYHTVVSADEGKKLQLFKQHTIMEKDEFDPEIEAYRLEGYMPTDHPLHFR